MVIENRQNAMCRFLLHDLILLLTTRKHCGEFKTILGILQINTYLSHL